LILNVKFSFLRLESLLSERSYFKTMIFNFKRYRAPLVNILDTDLYKVSAITNTYPTIEFSSSGLIYLQSTTTLDVHLCRYLNMLGIQIGFSS